MNESGPRSNVHYMSSSENKAWKEKKTFAYKIEIKKEIKKRGNKEFAIILVPNKPMK